MGNLSIFLLLFVFYLNIFLNSRIFVNLKVFDFRFDIFFLVIEVSDKGVVCNL